MTFKFRSKCKNILEAYVDEYARQLDENASMFDSVSATGDDENIYSKGGFTTSYYLSNIGAFVEARMKFNKIQQIMNRHYVSSVYNCTG